MDLTTAAPALRDESPFVVELDRFHGPLDLLLHLIRQQDIDIFDIPIAHITDQFLAAIEGIDTTGLDHAGEFLEMAATLVRIKVQMLLPRREEGEEEDPRAELVRRLLEYEQIRDVVSLLAAAEADRSRRFPKGYVEPRPRRPAAEAPLETTWDEVLEAALALPERRPRPLEHHLPTRPVAVEEKIRLILETLARVARVEFSRLVSPWGSRIHGVATLLAGLELSRRRWILLRQARPFSELWLYRREPEPGEGEGEEGP